MSTNYGRIRLDGNADSIDRLPRLANERRFDFNTRKEPENPMGGRICPECNTRRTVKEYEGVGEIFKNCSVCRGRGKSRETVKR